MMFENINKKALKRSLLIVMIISPLSAILMILTGLLMEDLMVIAFMWQGVFAPLYLVLLYRFFNWHRKINSEINNAA